MNSKTEGKRQKLDRRSKVWNLFTMLAHHIVILFCIYYIDAFSHNNVLVKSL